MGTCACSEQYFFYNINYDDEASQPRISGKKLISSTISAGGGYDNEGVRTVQQIFEFDVYTKPNVPLGKLLSLYGNSEMEKYACCFSPAGCIMANYTNIRLEYRGTNQPPPRAPWWSSLRGRSRR